MLSTCTFAAASIAGARAVAKSGSCERPGAYSIGRYSRGGLAGLSGIRARRPTGITTSCRARAAGSRWPTQRVSRPYSAARSTGKRSAAKCADEAEDLRHGVLLRACAARAICGRPASIESINRTKELPGPTSMKTRTPSR